MLRLFEAVALNSRKARVVEVVAREKPGLGAGRSLQPLRQLKTAISEQTGGALPLSIGGGAETVRCVPTP